MKEVCISCVFMLFIQSCCAMKTQVVYQPNAEDVKQFQEYNSIGLDQYLSSIERCVIKAHEAHITNKGVLEVLSEAITSTKKAFRTIDAGWPSHDPVLGDSVGQKGNFEMRLFELYQTLRHTLEEIEDSPEKTSVITGLRELGIIE